MDYLDLNKEDFDAIVTGELTHLAIWLEGELDNVISGYFVENHHRRGDFQRLILRRDGLSAQDKIEIVRAMFPLFNLSDDGLTKWKSLLKRIGDFKSWRNAMAHGVDVTPEPYEGELVIELVSRGGVEKQVRISTNSHKEMVIKAEGLLQEVTDARVALFESFLEEIQQSESVG